MDQCTKRPRTTFVVVGAGKAGAAPDGADGRLYGFAIGFGFGLAFGFGFALALWPDCPAIWPAI